MWLVHGAWAWLIVTSLIIFTQQGDVAAANHALPGLILVLLIHGSVWLYQRNKQPTTPQQKAAVQYAPSIDDSIYDQVADEMSSGNIHEGIMARAIAEADGEKDKAQAIYIKLRVAAISKEKEQAKQENPDQEADQWTIQASEDTRVNRVEQNSRSEPIQTEAAPIIERLFILLSLCLLGSGSYLIVAIFIDGNYYSEIWGAAALIALGGIGIHKLRW